MNIAVTGTAGDITVSTVSEPEFWTEVFPPPAPPDLRGLPPSRLLAASNRVVNFIGRERELCDLTAWREGTGLAARLIHGPGGQGKTRLATEFAERSAAAGQGPRDD